MTKRDRSEYIFIDADDTLWENERYFEEAKRDFALLLSSFASEKEVLELFNKYQEVNIPIYGYGSKTCLIGFLDAAADICGGVIPKEIYHKLKKIVEKILTHDLIIIDGVEETLAQLSSRYRLVVATKGEQMEQKAKFYRSGLDVYFEEIEVMDTKDDESYLKLAEKYSVDPHDMVMVGNSVKSDIVPVVSIGGTAIHVPHSLVWEHEIMEMPSSERAIEVENFRQLKNLLVN